jgi:hypothetical protein
MKWPKNEVLRQKREGRRFLLLLGKVNVELF